MRVIVDLSRCQGYANCVLAAPDVFDLDDDTGQAIVTQPDPAPELRDSARVAVANCPAQAITIEDDD